MMFRNKKPNIKKLLSFGFEEIDSSYVYICNLIGGQMKLTVTVSEDAKIYTKVTDNSSDEEYVLHRVLGASGAFVGQVKSEYNAILEEISSKCFEPDVFKSEQAKAIINHIRNTYADELEFLWQKFPENAVIRRKDNKKWYAAILTVSRRKLGLNSDEKVEILDLRMKPEDIENTVDGAKYFPGYHMNKKHWITVCLDGTVSLDEICKRINESYNLALK